MSEDLKPPLTRRGLELSWNTYSAALIALFAFFQAMQWPLLPKFLDIYYHLCVMKGFHDAGGYVTTAFWECAPAGRQHLYPPLLHTLMLAFYEAGLKPITIGRLVDCLSYPLLLTTVFWAVRRLSGERVAFWTLLLFSSSFSGYLASVTLSAFNLAVMLGLAALVFSVERRKIAAGLALALCFYAHTLMGWVTAAALLCAWIFALRERPLRGLLVSAGTGFLLAGPFLIYQIAHRSDFNFVRVVQNRQIDLEPFTMGLAIAGLWLSWNARRSIHGSAGSQALLGWTLASVPLLLTHANRFLSGHGLIAWSWLAALAIDAVFQKLATLRRRLLFLGGVFALFFFLAPVLRWEIGPKPPRVEWADRSAVRYLVPDPERDFRANGFSIYFPKEYDEIVQVVRASSSRNDILWCDFAHAGGVLSLLSDRATSSAMLAEVKRPGGQDPMKVAKLLIWFKTGEARAPSDMDGEVRMRGLIPVAETSMAFIYSNPHATPCNPPPKPLLPIPWMFLLTGAALTGMLLSDKFDKISIK